MGDPTKIRKSRDFYEDVGSPNANRGGGIERTMAAAASTLSLRPREKK